MELLTILREEEIPQELIDFKVAHYKEIFQEYWEEVYQKSPLLDTGEEMILMKDADAVAGGCIFKRSPYALRFRGLTILPSFRGQGLAQKMMQYLHESAVSYHGLLQSIGKKPLDINLMYLKSLVYLDANGSNQHHGSLFEFGSFLKKFNFIPCSYSQHELSDEEVAATQVYQQLGYSSRIKVFKKLVVDGGVELGFEAEKELLALDKRQWSIVMHGLEWKLGNYAKSGKMSYRYDLCPVCKDVGSSELNSENCRNCYIRTTCMEPFREAARFKEDFEVSFAYFSAMRDFMLKYRPNE